MGVQVAERAHEEHDAKRVTPAGASSVSSAAGTAKAEARGNVTPPVTGATVIAASACPPRASARPAGNPGRDVFGHLLARCVSDRTAVTSGPDARTTLGVRCCHGPCAPRVLQRAPTLVPASHPPHYVDPRIPGATLTLLGQRLHDSFYQYLVHENGVTFFYDATTGGYYDSVNTSIQPGQLSPPAPQGVASSSPGPPPDGDGGGGAVASSSATTVVGPLAGIHAADAMAKRKRRRSTTANRNDEASEVKPPEQKRRRTSQRRRFTVMRGFALALEQQYGATCDNAINQVFNGLHLHPYNMNGLQAATTNAEGQQFTTQLQMHSEMGALSAMLTAGTYQLVGGTVQPPPGGFNFNTPGVPHCGFCTFFLALLGLPLTQPSRGRFNLAVNLNYPMPPAVHNDIAVLDHLLTLGGAGPNAMQGVIALATQAGPPLTFAEFVERGYLDALWRFLLGRLYAYMR